MTCIVGHIDKGRVFIGADSAGIGGYNLTIRQDPKVFRVGEFIIGCTTSFRMIQLLMFKFNPPALESGADIFKYMCTDFIDAVIKCFKDNGFEDKGTDRDEIGGEFLVGYKDKLFRICADYQVEESTSLFNSCGCGANFALGAMAALKTKNISHKVMEALQIAESLSCGVAAPFKILST